MRTPRIGSVQRAGRLAVVALAATLMVMAAGSAWSDESRPDPKIEYRGTLLVQLRVSNLDKAIDFYTSTLNFQLVKRIDALHWAELSFGLPGVLVGLGEGDDARGSGTVSLNIGVQDVDRARTVLEQRGVAFLRPTLEIPGKVKLADFLDPDGNKIRLAESIRS